MSEMRDIKPNIRDEEAGPSQEPVTPRKPKGAKITLKVVNTNGEQLQIAMKPANTFQKLFDAAAQRFGLSTNLIRFTYDGVRIRPDQTPDELEMQDDDVIDIHVQQIGGAL